jgi:hypothetical protein
MYSTQRIWSFTTTVFSWAGLNKITFYTDNFPAAAKAKSQFSTTIQKVQPQAISGVRFRYGI